ncbi:hypothetical protein I79_004686 [Cricetulus griseus]|uniref:Uncharacterized protein n=1 Tax=Cricetulus griseus TaxID=10029 RepID=G3H373_CRIGR|nr:hypothetical protein I79_004686 [Cricetulus griseus]
MAPGFKAGGWARMTHWAPDLGSVTGEGDRPSAYQAPACYSVLDAGDEHIHGGGHYDLFKEHTVWGAPDLGRCSQQVLGVVQQILVPTAAESTQCQNGQYMVTPVEIGVLTAQRCP